MSTAFQPNAFQPNSYQIGKGSSGSGVNYTLTCAVGAYVYTGQAATLNRGITLACATGAYVYTGNAATLTHARSLACATGAYSYTGNAATLNRGIKLTCAAGAYLYVGKDATLTYVPSNTAYTLACAVGAYTYTGNAATLTYVNNNPITGHSGGDDGWKKEKPKKRKDDYKTNLIARKQAVLDAYNGLLDPETPETIAEEVKSVVKSVPIVDLDLTKVQKLLKLWEQELDRREEADDEEAILLLL